MEKERDLLLYDSNSRARIKGGQTVNQFQEEQLNILGFLTVTWVSKSK